MKRERNFSRSTRILLVAASLFFSLGAAQCKYKPPKHELCILDFTAEKGHFFSCFDEREDPEEYERSLDGSLNYLCSNPDDVEALRQWVERRLDECERE